MDAVHREERTCDSLSLGGAPGALGCTHPHQGAAHMEHYGILGLSLGKKLEQAGRRGLERLLVPVRRVGQGKPTHVLFGVCSSLPWPVVSSASVPQV